MSSVLSSRNFLIQAVPFLPDEAAHRFLSPNSPISFDRPRDHDLVASSFAKLAVVSSSFLHGSFVPEMLMSNQPRIQHGRNTEKLMDLLLLESQTSQFTTSISLGCARRRLSFPSSSLQTLIITRRYFTRQLLHLYVCGTISTDDQRLFLEECLPKLSALQTLKLRCDDKMDDDQIGTALGKLHNLKRLSLCFVGREPQTVKIEKVLTPNLHFYLRELSLSFDSNDDIDSVLPEFGTISKLFPDLEKLSIFIRVRNDHLRNQWANAETSSSNGPLDLSAMTCLTDLTLQADLTLEPMIMVVNPYAYPTYNSSPFAALAKDVDRLFGSASEVPCCKNLVRLNVAPSSEQAFKRFIHYVGGEDCRIKYVNFNRYGWLTDACVELAVSHLPLLEELDLTSGYSLTTPSRSLNAIIKHCRNLKRLVLPQYHSADASNNNNNNNCFVSKEALAHSARWVTQTLESLEIKSSCFLGVLDWFNVALSMPYQLRELNLGKCDDMPTNLFLEALRVFSPCLEKLVGPHELLEDYSNDASQVDCPWTIPRMEKLTELTVRCGRKVPASLIGLLVEKVPKLTDLTILLQATIPAKTNIWFERQPELFEQKVKFFEPVAKKLKMKSVEVNLWIRCDSYSAFRIVEACFVSNPCVKRIIYGTLANKEQNGTDEDDDFDKDNHDFEEGEASENESFVNVSDFDDSDDYNSDQESLNKLMME